jgi:hypothetical protein
VYVVLASGTGGIWNYINSSQCLYSKKTRAGGWQGIPKAGHSNLFLFFFCELDTGNLQAGSSDPELPPLKLGLRGRGRVDPYEQGQSFCVRFGWALKM